MKTKFCYNENVEIIGGFYKTQKGCIYSVKKVLWGKYYKVYLNLEKGKINGFTLGGELVRIKEKYLRSLDYPNKDFNEKLQKL